MRLLRVLIVLFVAAMGLMVSAGPAYAPPPPAVLPPVLTKAINPLAEPLGCCFSEVTFTITNPNPTTTLTGVGFLDRFPPDLTRPDDPVTGAEITPDTCGQPDIEVDNEPLLIAVEDATIPPGATCTIFLGDVIPTKLGPTVNTTFEVVSNEGGVGNTASATLLVGDPPTITKAFGTSPIPLGSSTTLTFTLTNPNPAQPVTVIRNPPPADLTGVAFTDALPMGLVVASLNGLTNSCGGIATAVAGSSSIELSGATIPMLSSCAVTVNVQGTTLGIKTNTTSAVTTEQQLTGQAATATLTVGSPPTLTKSFSPSTITVGSSTTMRITLTNPNPAPLTGAGFSDSLPAGLALLSLAGSSNTCGGVLFDTLASIRLEAGTIPASGSCTVAVNLQGTSPGTKTNTTSELTTAEGLTGTAASASVNVLPLPPTLTKTFTPSTVAVGATTRLTFTLTNPNPTVALSRITFADPFPSGLGVAATPMVASNCGGVPSVGPFALAVAYANASLPPGGNCTFSVNVTASSAGLKTNTTTIVSSSAGVGSPATGTLIVTP